MVQARLRPTHGSRTLLTLIVVPLLALALSACGDDDDEEAGATATGAEEQAQGENGGGEAPDLPTEFEGEFYQLVEEDGLPEGVSIDASEEVTLMDSLMASDDGTAALVWLSLSLPPPAEPEGGSASIECGGETVEGALVQEGGGSGLLRIEDMGAATLEIETSRAVFADAEAPPLCAESRGTWRGAYGPLEGRSGTFVTYGTHDYPEEGTFEAFLELTES